jgi:uncharacterized membrane protein
MENNNKSNSDNFKNALCYIPFVSIVLFFTEQKKSKDLMKHIKYWSYLLFAFVLIRFIVVWILMIPISWLLFLVYIWITGFFWYKVYSWEDVDIEYIDEFDEKLKENMGNSNNKEK